MGILWRGTQKFSRVEVIPGGAAIGFGEGYVGNQKFYVNTDSATYPGNDSNDGLSYNTPLLTIKAALAKCVDGRNDVIYIINYWQASGEDWPIVINKKLVHIVGVAQPNLPYPSIHPPSDTACFTIHENGSYSEIAYLTIGGGNSFAGISLGPASSPNTKPEGVYIHDCTFGHTWFGTPLSGIDSKEYGAVSCRIERCTFLGDLVQAGGKISGNGIDLTTTSAFHEDLVIKDCYFMGVAIGINLAKGKGAVITGNVFTIVDSAEGEAITLGAATLGCLIDDNRVANLETQSTKTGYRDLGSTKSHWGLNYTSILAKLPATS